MQRNDYILLQFKVNNFYLYLFIYICNIYLYLLKWIRINFYTNIY